MYSENCYKIKGGFLENDVHGDLDVAGTGSGNCFRLLIVFALFCFFLFHIPSIKRQICKFALLELGIFN